LSSQPSQRPLRGPLRPIIRPLWEFLREEAAGGALLLLAAMAALVWINAPGGDSYTDLWDRRAGADLGFADLNLTLGTWVNDGLMTVFFFVVGLEIKREILNGELSDRRAAALPVAAALGGMVVPASIYAALNASGDGARGWGVPMATDIAFAVGVLALLGPRVPLSLKVFLLALAIVDDIGAITVIAIFYADGVSPAWAAVAVAVFATTGALALLNVRLLAAYLVLAVVAWLAIHESGVHATIAGVIMALLTPVDHGADPRSATVLDRLEHILHPWSSFVIIPVFALANAGIELDGGAVRDAISSPVSLGVAAGLLAGKPLGITIFALIAVRAGIASLPRDVQWRQLAGAGFVAGIGFTVSLFISELAFADPALGDEAKIGILAGSCVAGVAGYVLLRALPGSTASSDAENAKG
jgi:NhaA family Na+:H+ antiporter